jgi:hypothetical protein
MRAASHAVSVVIEKAALPSPICSNHLTDNAHVQLVPVVNWRTERGQFNCTFEMLNRKNVIVLY